MASERVKTKQQAEASRRFRSGLAGRLDRIEANLAQVAKVLEMKLQPESKREQEERQ